MLEIIIVIALFVWGIHVVFWNSMILGFVSRWLMYRIPTWLQKILYACPICMTPYYGSLLYWLRWHDNILDWAICIISAMGLSGIIVTLIPETFTLEEDDSPGDEDPDPRHN